MSLNHVVVWLDQAEAHVIHFNRETSESEVVKTASNRHHKTGVEVSSQAADQSPYLSEIAAAIADASGILIVGPGIEKMQFIKHLNKSHTAIAEKVVGVESVDHPSDGQLLAYARKYFIKEVLS
ncbi:translational machinery protein [Janthinobacterium sp.]|uniref:translational machinery protein n=1 Tax=Janthinobacterium sp. TaxID=1871054 RepID=UPI00293D32F4|nr:translational machinery protein [Janthinobacterium sp.]